MEAITQRNLNYLLSPLILKIIFNTTSGIRLKAAEQHLKNYLNKIDEIPAGMRNMVWIDAAFFYSFAKLDLLIAEKY